MGFVDFTKLPFAFSSLAQPFNQMGNIPEYVFVILSQRKAYAGLFQKETAGKRTGPMTKWPPRRLLFTRLEIVFVTISPFSKRTKVVPKVFQEGECCLEGLINLTCGLQLQMLATEAERPFYERARMVLHVTRRQSTASAVSVSAIFSCEISDFGQQLSV